MERRNFIAAALAVPVMGLLAACGSESTGDSLQTSDTTVDTAAETPAVETTPPETEPPATVVEAAPLSGDLVLSYTLPGGFTTREFAFQNPPVALITADGTLLSGALTPAIFPGPLLPQHQAQTVSPEGIDALLEAADAAGLLADVDYSTDDELLIADAPTATLTIVADGATYTHEAYALGVGGGPGTGGSESTPERQALLDFLNALQSDPASIMGAENLGASAEYVPGAYQLTASPIDDLSAFDPAPTVTPWPADTGIELSSATDCVEIAREAVGDLFDAATQLTFFAEGDLTYQVTARPAYPGTSC